MAQPAAKRREFESIDSYRYNDLVLTCLFPKPLTPRELRMKLQSFCHDFLELIRREYGLTIYIAVSPIYRRLQELGTAYAETSALIDASFFQSEGQVLFPSASGPAGESGRFSIIRDLELFNRMLEQATSEDIIGHLEGFLEHISAFSEGNIRVAKGLLSDICLATARYYYRTTGDEFGFDKSINEVLEWEFCRDVVKDPLRTTFQDFDWADEVVHAGFGQKWIVDAVYGGDARRAQAAADDTMTKRAAYMAQFDITHLLSANPRKYVIMK